MRDYLLITHPLTKAGATEEFEVRFQEILEAVRSACPEVRWQADFVLGPTDCVEVFSAPSEQTAMRVAELVRTLGRLRAQAVPLPSRW